MVNEALTQADQYAVGWGTLALLNAGLAEAKGRSRLNWFLLSLLGGPLATLLLVLMDRLPRPTADEAPHARQGHPSAT